LAPETLAFVAELNAESERLNAGVKYLGLANKIEVTGDIHRAANRTTSLGAGSCAARQGPGTLRAKNGHSGRSIHNGGGSCASVPKENPNKSPDTFCLPGVYPYGKNPMNSFRQVLATIYVALVEPMTKTTASTRATPSSLMI